MLKIPNKPLKVMESMLYLPTDLQHMLRRPTWEELTAKRKSNFARKIDFLPTTSLVRTAFG